jgi:hypothetical protein
MLYSVVIIYSLVTTVLQLLFDHFVSELSYATMQVLARISNPCAMGGSVIVHC